MTLGSGLRRLGRFRGLGGLPTLPRFRRLGGLRGLTFSGTALGCFPGVVSRLRGGGGRGLRERGQRERSGRRRRPGGHAVVRALLLLIGNVSRWPCRGLLRARPGRCRPGDLTATLLGQGPQERPNQWLRRVQRSGYGRLRGRAEGRELRDGEGKDGADPNGARGEQGSSELSSALPLSRVVRSIHANPLSPCVISAAPRVFLNGRANPDAGERAGSWAFRPSPPSPARPTPTGPRVT
jgi:hypothetical protein